MTGKKPTGTFVSQGKKKQKSLLINQSELDAMRAKGLSGEHGAGRDDETQALFLQLLVYADTRKFVPMNRWSQSETRVETPGVVYF